MKNLASLLIFLCSTAAFLIAGEIKTRIVTSATSPSIINVLDHFHLRIFNFTQQGGTTRGVVIAAAAAPTATPTATLAPTPTATPAGTDLTATKTDNVGGQAISPNPWTWTIHVANGGNMSGTFASGQTILSDNLPSASITYDSLFVSNLVNVTGVISCTISGSDDLTCTASGTVTIGSNGSFDVSFSAMPTMSGTFTNPRAGGACSVDPNNAVSETNESNNTCADTVASSTPPPPPQTVLTAALIDPNSPPEFIRQVVVDGPAQVSVICPASATCVITYQKEFEPTPTPTPSPIIIITSTATPTPTPMPTATPM